MRKTLSAGGFSRFRREVITFSNRQPEVLVHDLHPDYQSTRYAKERESRLCIAVQHHHAHIAAVAAEHLAALLAQVALVVVARGQLQLPNLQHLLKQLLEPLTLAAVAGTEWLIGTL